MATMVDEHVLPSFKSELQIEQNKSIITEADYAILQRGATHQIFQIHSRKPVYLCKQKISLSNTIGLPYGSVFQIKGKDLCIIKQPILELQPTVDTGISVEDNRNLIDNCTSQQLTKDDIESLKAEGVSSEVIVKNLVESSLTFNSKTQFSQEKYLKKKKDKYSNCVRVLRTNIRLLTELYHQQGPTKICNLRLDMLSQMLSASNVMYGGCYLVVDSCLGLLVAAVLEKVNPGGKVVQVYMEPGPTSAYRQAVHAMNFQPEIIKKTLFGISYHNLNSSSKTAENGSKRTATEENNHSKRIATDENNVIKNNSNSLASSLVNKQCVERNSEPMDLDSPADSEDKSGSFLERKKAKLDRKALRSLETEEALRILNGKNLDGLLMCCRQPSVSEAVGLLDYLAPSRPFAIHSMTLQPLVETYDQIKSANKAVFLKLSETWLRKYQVLPDRTHPEINMSNTGGYLLTGIKVEPVCK